jgi:hypothetical protein
LRCLKKNKAKEEFQLIHFKNPKEYKILTAYPLYPA